MNYFENKEEIIDEIVSDIQNKSIEGKWFISFDQLINVIGLKKEVFYKTLYSMRKLQYSSIPIKGFCEKDGDHLCLFLDKLLNTKITSNKFLKTGVYFNKSSLESLKVIFMESIKNVLENHKLDKELMGLLISSTMSYDDAFDSYFDNKVNMDLLISKSIDTFYTTMHVDAKYDTEVLLEDFLKKLVAHNKIPFYKITAKYRFRYYYTIFGKEPPGYKTEYSELYRLLDFFNLSANSTKQELKKKYTQLIKKYHPDINKDGLEDTKIIIENYNKLQAMLK
ncbi:MAG: DnaJ domain-containing protein [Leptospiraceae bacterium]|nr:DnaJ domain-containing protein [Leptospiraceae bacterium]